MICVYCCINPCRCVCVLCVTYCMCLCVCLWYFTWCTDSESSDGSSLPNSPTKPPSIKFPATLSGSPPKPLTSPKVVAGSPPKPLTSSKVGESLENGLAQSPCEYAAAAGHNLKATLPRTSVEITCQCG